MTRLAFAFGHTVWSIGLWPPVIERLSWSKDFLVVFELYSGESRWE